MPISRFAAGPIRDSTSHTTLSPNVQHWWRDGLKLNYPRAELRGQCSIKDGYLGAWGRARRQIVHTAVVVAAIAVVVLVRGTLVNFLVCVARRLVDGRCEVKIRPMSGRNSRWCDGSTHHRRAWRVEWTRCCEVRGIASLEEAREAFLHFLDSALLGSISCSAIPL